MDAMSFARLFSSLLLDSAAKGTVLLLLACLAARLCHRSSAALRHSIWCMTMGGLLLLPIASWALPAWQLPILRPEPIVAAETGRLPATTLGLPEPVTGQPVAPSFSSEPRSSTGSRDTSGLREAVLLPQLPIETASSAPLPEPSVIAEPALTIMEWISLLVGVSWSMGVVLFGSVLLVGIWRTVQLRRTSQTVSDGEWPGMLALLGQRLGLRWHVELREHAESVVPLTWGIWRPVVLVPQLAREWAEPMRRAVLLHELSHVQRGDVACQVLGRLTCVLFWFHPLSWFALRQLRQEREQACDDAVVQSGEKASDYAEQLLAVARMCCAPRGLSLAVAMAEGSSLERRVKSLFDSARSHGPVRRIVAVALVITGVLTVGTISSMEPVASSAAVTMDAEEIVTTPMGVASPEEIALLNPVFGEAKRGIQMGVATTSRQNVSVGERIPLRLFFRNVRDKEVTFQYHPDFMAYPPSVVNAKGETIGISSLLTFMEKPTFTVTLTPGETYGFPTYGLGLGKDQNAPSFLDPVAGKYKLTFSEGIFWSLNDPAEKWSERLHTGPLEFEIVQVGGKSVIARVLPNPQEESHAEPKAVATVGISGRAAKEQHDPEEGIVQAPGPMPTPADADPPDADPMPVGQNTEANIPLDDLVIWGKAVDGLESGFWLQKTGEPLNQRVPYNSLVTYRVVVRNTTNKPRDCLIRLLQTEPDVPYLISSDEITPALEAPELPQKCRAVAAPNLLSGIDAAYIVSLAPDESIILPGEYSLYVGDQPQPGDPHIAEIRPEMNWIVQPVLARAPTAAEQAALKGDSGSFEITHVDREGHSRRGTAKQVPAPNDRYTHVAKIQLEVGTLNAAASRNAEKATWGEVDRGMQCGIRVLNARVSYQTGDTLEAEILYRNASDAIFYTTLPRQLDLYPIIEDVNDGQPQIDFGARYNLLPGGHEYQPGEVRSLGVVKVMLVPEGTPSPQSNMEPGHITLQPGNYKLLGSGGVGEICPHSGKVAFTVAEPTAATSEPVGKAIRGQIINEQKLGVPNAEVLIVAGNDWNQSREGRVVAQGMADEKGNFSIAIQDKELKEQPWSQVWRRDAGFAIRDDEQN